MKIENKQKATVFGVKENEKIKKTMTGTISTYEGKDKNGEPRYSSWRANFVSDAFEKAKELTDKERILITNGKVDNQYVKDKNTAFYTVTIFDFEKDVKEDN